MTRKPATRPPAKAGAAANPAKLKASGDVALARGEHAKALAAYDAALAAATSAAAPPSEAAALHTARAGALLAGRRFREAATAAASALAADPAAPDAHARRARALECLGMYKAALADAKAAARAPGAGPDAAETERRLRELVAGRKPGGGAAGGGANGTGNGAGGVQAAAPQQQQQQQQQQQEPAQVVLTAKVTRAGGGEAGEPARLVHFLPGTTLAELAHAAGAKFGLDWPLFEADPADGREGGGDGGGGGGVSPAAAAAAAAVPPPPFTLSWSDGSGGPPVALADHQDLARAVAALVDGVQAAALEAAGGGPGAAAAAQRAVAAAAASGRLPPLELTLTPGTPGPAPPAEEVAIAAINRARSAARAAELRRYAAASAAAAAAKTAAAAEAEAAAAAASPAYAPADAWLQDLAALVRDRLGIDPDRAAELAGVGWDRLSAAVEAVGAGSDDAVWPVFDAAADKFNESASAATVGSGNVDLARAHAVLGRAALARGGGKAAAALPKEAVAEAARHLDAAAEKYKAALAVRPGYHDALAAAASLSLERAKLAAGLAVPPPAPVPPPEEGGPADGSAARDAAVAAAQNAALHGALATVDGAALAKAAPFFEEAWSGFAAAEAAVPEADRGRKQVFPEQQAGGGGDGGEAASSAAAPGEANAWANVMVMWGNALFEASQLHAAVGKKGEDGAWRAPLDEAVSKFRAAGCPEADITAALRSHVRAGELGLPPVEVEAKGVGESGGDKKGGLPALPDKGKKKGGK